MSENLKYIEKDFIESVAYCGIECSICPTYIASQNDNDKMRENVVIKLRKDFNLNVHLDL